MAKSPADHDTPAGPGSLPGLIERVGLTPSPDVLRLSAFAATVQQHRHDTGASPHLRTTRSTALWSAMQLVPDVRATLEKAGTRKADLAKALELKSERFPPTATTTECHEDLTHAVQTYLAQRRLSGPVDVAEVVLAILLSAKDPSRGVIAGRLRDLDQAISAVERLLGVVTPAPPAFDPSEFSGSIRELRSRFSDFPGVTPGALARALQAGEAHADYAAGHFRGLSFHEQGEQATFERWALRVRGLYDMEVVRRGPQKVIDGRMFLLALAALDADFATQLDQQGVRGYLATEVRVPLLNQPQPDRVGGGDDSGPGTGPDAGPDGGGDGSGDGNGDGGDGNGDGGDDRGASLDEGSAGGDDGGDDRGGADGGESGHGEADDAGDEQSGDLEGGVSSEFVDPTKGISLENDRMGVAPYVSMLATVICDRDTKMPLSVGVFGEWGSGKSYFMGLLRGRIDFVRTTDETKYWRDIKQISFNAWHYADSNLWASLGDEIFRQLLQEPDPDVARQQQLREQLGAAVEQRRELEASARHAEAKVGRLRTQIAEASAQRDVRATTLLKAMGNNPAVKKGLDQAWRRLGISDPSEQARILAAEVRGTANEAMVIRRSIAGRRGVLIAALAFLALLAVGLVALWPEGNLTSVLRAAAAAVSGFLATAVALTTWAHQGLRTLRTQIDTIKTDSTTAADRALAGPLQELRDAEAARDLAQAQLVTVVDRVGELGRELAELAPGQRLYTFLAERVAAGDYARNLGLISTIRKDFQELTVLMAKWRDLREKNEPAPRPIDRIVLYIDDLDRCSPRQVVEVLQAVHLLLALDLFVVIVGVDPRWLVRSLQQQYPKLLDAPDKGQGVSDGWDASPEDYLEKIFGIPFILPGMKGHLERVLTGIFEDQRADEETDGTGADETGADGTGASRTEGGDGTVREHHDDDGPGTPVTPGTGARRPDLVPVAEARVVPESGSLVASQDVAQDGQGSAGGQDDGDTGARTTLPPARPLTVPEITLLGALEPLVKTPREAKRLANVYRMIRASKDLSDASRFMGTQDHPGEYQAVVVLLGLLSAHARLLGAVLDTPAEGGRQGGLMSRRPTQRWSAFVKGMEPRQVDGVWTNDIVATISPADRVAWLALASGLKPVTALMPKRDLSVLQAWAPSIRRFSFVIS